MILSKNLRILWQDHIRTLKRHQPTSKPVTIRTRPIVRLDGDEVCGLYDNQKERHLILINRRCSWDEKVDSLIHEYAHALQHEGMRAGLIYTDEHSNDWGKHYSRCYTLIHGD